MKRHFAVVAALLGMSLLGITSVQAAQTRIGVIDVNYVVMHSKRGQAAKDELEQLRSSKKESLQEHYKSLMAEKQKLEDQAKAKKSPDKAEMDQYKKDAQAFQKEYGDTRQEIQNRENDLLKPIQDELNDVLAAYAKKHGYGLILTKQGNVAYNTDAFDVTQDVLTELDARYASEGKSKKK